MRPQKGVCDNERAILEVDTFPCYSLVIGQPGWGVHLISGGPGQAGPPCTLATIYLVSEICYVPLKNISSNSDS